MRRRAKQSANVDNYAHLLPAKVDVMTLSGWSHRIGVKGNPTDATTMLDHALGWIERGLVIYPAERYLGKPLVGSYYKDATNDEKQVVDWWAQWPTADIGCVPSRSKHYVIACFEDEGGLHSLSELQAGLGTLPAEFVTEDAWGNLYLWIRGEAYTSHNRIAPGIHVLGTGMTLFLPCSCAPHIVYRTQETANAGR